MLYERFSSTVEINNDICSQFILFTPVRANNRSPLHPYTPHPTPLHPTPYTLHPKAE
ncbi:MAG: hypothetical protein SAL70_02560 [Scytonema sp. PMC 1070.18]|nr:hypothetical protein [Scytonema sp. PMC 1070.18]